MRITNPTCKIGNSEFSKNVRFEKGVRIEPGSYIQCNLIGKYSYINKYCLIDKNTLSIGRFCSIAYNVRIGLGAHPENWVSSHAFAYDNKYGFNNSANHFSYDGETVIGNDVWIGANATILAGVKVGDGAIIGAHALVTKDVEPYSIVIGTPAKRLRYRFDEETIKKLMTIKWWNWNDEKIKENIHLFQNPEKFAETFI